MIDFCEVLEYNGKEASPIESERSANTPSRLRRDSDLRKGNPLDPLKPTPERTIKPCQMFSLERPKSATP